MTEFFSNFGKKISNVGQETVKKTKEIAEISKISSKIKDEEKKLDGLYTELGKNTFICILEIKWRKYKIFVHL